VESPIILLMSHELCQIADSIGPPGSSEENCYPYYLYGKTYRLSRSRINLGGKWPLIPGFTSSRRCRIDATATLKIALESLKDGNQKALYISRVVRRLVVVGECKLSIRLR
jgi:hypothetical protein